VKHRLAWLRIGAPTCEGNDRAVADQPLVSFAELLRRLRTDARLTQEELAEAAGLSPRSVSDLERGINRTAQRSTAVLLADALRLSGPRRERFIAAARGKAGLAPHENLPAELTAFIGRDREAADVRALAETSRLVTLTGPGGAGKTRLALHVAAGQLGVPGDGVWLVELALVTQEDDVGAAVAGSLGIPLQLGRAALDVLADALAPQEIIILLDNCEHLVSSCAKVADTLLRHCPKLRLIATSREPLSIAGETVYRVPSLSLPSADDDSIAAAESSDAIRLLAERAGAQGVSIPLNDDTGPVVASVCRRLDGMPLAIELAAARLRSMSLSELSGRLDQRFRLLTGGSRTALPRQQTLQAAISWSYSLLTAAEQALLRRLSVFAGPFDLRAAEAVGGFEDIDAGDVAALLGSLVDKSLVVADTDAEIARYRLLETIRLYAAELAGDDGADIAHAGDAHCAHFLAVVEEAAAHMVGSDQGHWFTRLDGDYTNVRSAARHAASTPAGTTQLLRFGVALWRYWTVRPGTDEIAALLVSALGRPEATADPGLFASALTVTSLFTIFGDPPASLTFAERGVAQARTLADEELLIHALAMLCFAYYFGGEPGQARESAAEAVERARQLGDDVLMGLSLYTFLLASESTATSLYAEAIACTERSGDLRINAYLHNEAGLAALESGDIANAKAHLEAGIRAARAIGDSHLAMSANLALVYRVEKDFDGARSVLEEVLRVGRRIGSVRATAFAVLGLACLAADLADWRRAAMLHGVAQAMRDQTGLLWEPFDARYRQQSLDLIGAALGPEELQRAYEEGTALSYDSAIDLALAATIAP
jgi:predicted ATPase/DNA-binding XRE family transcriptional regulator/tetratricopeptide (TPR) repeat protein